MSQATPVELRAGDLRAALRPDLGGCVAGFWKGDVAVLRSSEPAELASARPSGCYPLVPYSNRVGFRRFHWLGRDYTTAANFDDNPHSVHGVAWQRPWDVVGVDADQVELHYRHEPDAHWPFAFDVTQHAVLTPTTLELRLVFTNSAPVAQPVGLGWHPYFPKRAGARLQIDVSQRWDSDASGLPTHQLPQPGIAGAVTDLSFDNCFDGWQGDAQIADERLALRLSANLRHLVVFTPATKPYYCVEPVSHVSNAIQMADPLAHGLRALAPGERFEAWMQIEVGEA